MELSRPDSFGQGGTVWKQSGDRTGSQCSSSRIADEMELNLWIWRMSRAAAFRIDCRRSSRYECTPNITLLFIILLFVNFILLNFTKFILLLYYWRFIPLTAFTLTFRGLLSPVALFDMLRRLFGTVSPAIWLIFLCHWTISKDNLKHTCSINVTVTDRPPVRACDSISS